MHPVCTSVYVSPAYDFLLSCSAPSFPCLNCFLNGRQFYFFLSSSFLSPWLLTLLTPFTSFNPSSPLSSSLILLSLFSLSFSSHTLIPLFLLYYCSHTALVYPGTPPPSFAPCIFFPPNTLAPHSQSTSSLDVESHSSSSPPPPPTSTTTTGMLTHPCTTPHTHSPPLTPSTMALISLKTLSPPNTFSLPSHSSPSFKQLLLPHPFLPFLITSTTNRQKLFFTYSMQQQATGKERRIIGSNWFGIGPSPMSFSTIPPPSLSLAPISVITLLY